MVRTTKVSDLKSHLLFHLEDLDWTRELLLEYCHLSRQVVRRDRTMVVLDSMVVILRCPLTPCTVTPTGPPGPPPRPCVSCGQSRIGGVYRSGPRPETCDRQGTRDRGVRPRASPCPRLRSVPRTCPLTVGE